MNPICEVEGCRFVAYEIDHIVPLAHGGDRWAWTNLMAMCREHHAEKTKRDRRRPRGDA